MQFSDAILEYSFDCKVRKLSPKTIENYQKQLRYLQRYLENEYGVKEVQEVRGYHIKQFLSMMDDKQCKPRYINDLLKVFKTFFNYLKAEGHTNGCPTAQIHNMKQPKLRILTFTPNEIRSMLNHFSGRDYLSIRNRTILAMMFDTGMRINEVITMCADQIREDHIIVHGKGNKERVVPVSPYLAKALMQYQVARESYFESNASGISIVRGNLIVSVTATVMAESLDGNGIYASGIAFNGGTLVSKTHFPLYDVEPEYENLYPAFNVPPSIAEGLEYYWTTAEGFQSYNTEIGPTVPEEFENAKYIELRDSPYVPPVPPTPSVPLVIPQTGDNTPVALWLTLFTASAICLLLMAKRKHA